MNEIIIREARAEEAPFLAKCIMAGMHFYDFETEVPEDEQIYLRLVDCERREDLLYSYTRTRVAEVDDGKVVAALISYPGEIYRDLREKTFSELWPEFAAMNASSDQETGPGEYYLDSLAILPEYRGKGIGRALIRDGIEKGLALGYKTISLVADSDMPHLVSLYESLGFRKQEIRHAFGVEFQRMLLSI